MRALWPGSTRLKVGSVGAVCVAGVLVISSGAVAGYNPLKHSVRPESARPQNVIIMIGDGMGPNHIAAARMRYYGVKKQLHMEEVPGLGTVATYAVKKESAKPDTVTDSAAAATAWATGHKTYNGAIGRDVRGRSVPSLMELAKSTGMRTGNISTAKVTDATPAAMFAHVSTRDCQGPDFKTTECKEGDVPIATQLSSNNVADVIFGGGMSVFRAADAARLKANGYTVLGSIEAGQPARAADLESVGPATGKVFGLFSAGNLTLEKVKREYPNSAQAQEPNLTAMTKKAIEVLTHSTAGKGSSKGFFLQVEGALIDKRSHDNAAAAVLEEVKGFDSAVAAALEFARKDGNTLVIVTADHECGGLAMLTPDPTNAENLAPPRNDDPSNSANDSKPARTVKPEVDPHRTFGPSNGDGAAQASNFAPATFRTPSDPPAIRDGDPKASLRLAFVSGQHTGGDVNIFTYGPGFRLFQGRINNTDIFKHVRRLLRL